MPDKLYRSHSLEKSGDTISGSLTIWEDNPVSPFDVGDTFTPVQGCPLLTVEKVNIKDNVIGELNGKPLRQWEITIEGSNGVSASSGSQTHVKYNFTISEDEKTGTMEVVNKGSSPSITLSVGSRFSVPGVGQVKCTSVKGSDSYDDNDVHMWTVIYEGSTKSSEEDPDNPEKIDKYSVSVEKTSDGVTIYSGSKEVTYTGASPSLASVGSSVSLPIIGSVTCTKSYATKTDTDTWTITTEGSREEEPQGVDLSKYSVSVEKTSDDVTVYSGSKEVTYKGNNPTLASVGSSVSLPIIGSVTCTRSQATKIDADTWTISYEGSKEVEPENIDKTKYSVSVEKNSDGVTIYSGSKEEEYKGKSPSLASVGSSVSLPIIGSVTCTKSYATKTGTDTWTITTEGSRKGDTSTDLPDTETVINYEINGVTLRSVAGEFIALRRSTTPITKKTITEYTNTVVAVATPGSTYQGGTVLSESISKETIKENGVVISTYYRHTIEVES